MCSPNLCAVQLDQPAAMLVLLVRHLGEDLGGGGEGDLQAVGIVGIDARILLLGRDGERQDLLLRQVCECLHRIDPRSALN